MDTLALAGVGGLLLVVLLFLLSRRLEMSPVALLGVVGLVLLLGRYVMFLLEEATPVSGLPCAVPRSWAYTNARDGGVVPGLCVRDRRICSSPSSSSPPALDTVLPVACGPRGAPAVHPCGRRH
jgi:hypothetical protein